MFVLLTRVVVENYIEKVLVSPGYVEFVFLEQRHQQLLPMQPHRCHVILSTRTQVLTTVKQDFL